MIRRHVLASVVVLAALLLSTGAYAQEPAPQARGGGPPAAAPRNLQVLPKDMAPPQVLQVMQNIAQGLGVQCGYCHVQNAGPEGGRGDAAAGGRGGRGGPPPFDFASDDKPQKKAAREMMLMVRDINPKVATAVGKSAEAATRVGCVTCHRGVAIPRQLADVLDQTTMEKGLQAAVAQYKDLRKQYFGGQAYDFSEGSLVTYAQRATQANKPDDAIVWLQANLEYFPLSSRTYAGLSQAQQRKNDKDGALKSLEKAVELDPQNAPLKRQLDTLKGQ
jgi:Photosynthetic reaction centre cytochrome C subunit